MAGTCERRAGKFARLLMGTAALTVMGLGAMAPGVALAQETRRYELRLPAESLQGALRRLQRQAGSRIIYSPGQVSGVTTSGLTGSYTVTQALDALLAGTALTYRVQNGGAIVIVPRSSAAQSGVSRTLTSTTATQVDEIVVTARKRDEAARDVAGGLTALAGASLEDRGVRGIDEMTAYTPGMQFVTSTPGLGQITLRGVTTGVQQSSATVATYVDDTPFTPSSRTASGTTVVPDLDPFDIRRVEVLRGPQGTLYGAAAMGGLLKYVTTQPSTERLSGRLSAEAGMFNGGGESYAFRGLVNLPVTDTLALRLSAGTRHSDGFIDDVGLGLDRVNGFDQDSARLAVLYSPNDMFSARWTTTYQNNHSDASPVVDIALATGVPAYGDLTQKRLLLESTDQDYLIHALSLDFDFGWAKLTSATSYADVDISSLSDQTPSLATAAAYYSTLLGYPLALSAARVSAPTSIQNQKFTQEFRLASPEDRALKWLAGLYYTREETETSQAFKVYSATGSTVAPLIADAYSLSIPSTFEEYAVFANASYDLTSRFNLAVGVRLSTNDQTGEQVSVGFLNSPSAPTTATRLESKSSEDVATYYIAPRLILTPDINAYAVVASGYRPGGPNGVPPTAPTIPSSFESDQLWSYEAGLKTRWLERRLTVDVSLFKIDWSDIQLSSTTSGFTYLVNGGKASSQGVEFDIAYRPMPGLRLAANGAYTDAQLDEAAASIGGRDGDPLPTVPRRAYSLIADYSFAAFGDWTGALGATYQFVGARHAGFGASTTRPDYLLESYATLNFRASLSNGDWTVALYADNLTDERALLAANTSLTTSGQPVRATVTPPLSVGLRLSRAF